MVRKSVTILGILLRKGVARVVNRDKPFDRKPDTISCALKEQKAIGDQFGVKFSTAEKYPENHLRWKPSVRIRHFRYSPQ